MITIDINIQSVEHLIQSLIDKAIDTAPAMREVSEILYDATMTTFEKEGRGKGWPKLSPKRVSQRLKNKTWPAKILQEKGDLVSSIHTKSSINYAIVGTNNPYAARHHFGDPKINLPQRRFLPSNIFQLKEGNEVTKVLYTHLTDVNG